MKKRILFLSPLPPPYYGSAISSKECLQILKESKDFEVKHIKLNYSKEMGDVGNINFSKIAGIPKVSRQIKESKKFNPDIIYFMPATSSLGLYRDYYFFKQIKKYFKGKILFHIRSRIDNQDWKKHKRKYKNMFGNQKAIILGKELEPDSHKLISKKNIFILPNAIKNEISSKKFKQIMNKRKQRNSFNIFFLSNMDKTKGWPKLLEACRILAKKEISFKCNFVGEWPTKKEEREFSKFIIQNNLTKNVFYLGRKIGKEKNKVLEDSDVLVFPTEYKLETFGRVIIEAMMFGLPVIANGIATIPSIIKNDKTGFVLKQNSPKEISEYLIKLQNQNLREKMGKEGRKRFLKEYESKKYKKEFIKILKQI